MFKTRSALPHPAIYGIPSLVAVIAAALAIARLADTEAPASWEVALPLVAGVLALVTIYLSAEALARHRAVYQAAITDAADVHAEVTLLLREFDAGNVDREVLERAGTAMSAYHQLANVVPGALRTEVGDSLAGQVHELEARVRPESGPDHPEPRTRRYKI